MKTVLPFLILVLALFTSCADSDETLRAHVDSELHAKLSIGDPAEKIERVLNEQKLPFSFDSFTSRYQSGLDPKEKRKVPRVVTVWIYVDQAKRLTKIEVQNTYTFL